MAEIINLNKVRKARERTAAKEQAAANRTRSGRSKAEKARDAAEAKRLVEKLDGAKRDGD